MKEKFMLEAIRLAKKGIGFTNPNPLVGAVLVKEDTILSRGYHRFYSGPHAEVNVIKKIQDFTDTTLYVTLEPCCHHGKTPPCTDLIIKSGIKKVVIGTLDPNPLVAGKGVEILRKHGVDVEVGCLASEIKQMNEIFNHYILEKTPYVILKYAMTLDGKIATMTGDSKWITNESSRKLVHETRQQVMGILIGVNTVLADDPELTTRLDKKCSHPMPIILDTNGRIPLKSKLLKRPAIIATHYMSDDKRNLLKGMDIEVMDIPLKDQYLDLEVLLQKLGELGLDSILVEGGAKIHGSFLKQHLVHKVQAFMAPKIIGDGISPIQGMSNEKMSEAVELHQIAYRFFGNDILVEGYTKEGLCLQAL